MLRIVDIERAFRPVTSSVTETFAVLDPQIPANERVWSIGPAGLASASREARNGPSRAPDSHAKPTVLSMAGLAARYLMWSANARLGGPAPSAAGQGEGVCRGRTPASPRPFLLLESF
jgi:hypothetical protein